MGGAHRPLNFKAGGFPLAGRAPRRTPTGAGARFLSTEEGVTQMRYASETRVSVAKSRGEIEDMVQRAGGTRFAAMNDSVEARAVVLFELADRRVMFELPVPSREEFAYRERYGRRVKADPDWQMREWEQACRVKWRALALAIKAKLVSVESGVETLEEAFLAHLVVPTGEGARRFASVAVKAIAQAYTGGTLPPLLGSGQ